MEHKKVTALWLVKFEMKLHLNIFFYLSSFW